MKENLEHKLRIFQIVILNTKLRLQISQKVVCEKFYAHKKKFYVYEIAAVNLSKFTF